ncbi:MAG: glycosyltransferase [Anaerolineae bacterium]|nr:glycosyltransferase [Anaerolineae bacterium]
MRVLLIYSTANLGGAEIYALNLMEVLGAGGVEFTLVAPYGSFIGAQARQRGIRVLEAPITYPEFDGTALVQCAYQTMAALRHNKPDLIHVHHLPAALVGQFISAQWQIPLLMALDSAYLREPYRQFIASTECALMVASPGGIFPPDQRWAGFPGDDLRCGTGR